MSLQVSARERERGKDGREGWIRSYRWVRGRERKGWEGGVVVSVQVGERERERGRDGGDSHTGGKKGEREG